METINVSFNVKPFNQLTDQEICNLTEHMGRSKSDLLTLFHYFSDNETVCLANLYIANDEDVREFEADFFSGDYDGLHDDLMEYIKHCYALNN